ncbi:MAG: glycoside hydrolase family 127 protein [Candidatus Hydrogenedentes bacterium]|nr:glycoside hydrolase family 127 protein [Candidatus Hydrogenedentota bacterium]
MKSKWVHVTCGMFLCALTARGNVFTTVDIRNVEVRGEIGDRISATIDNNLMALEADQDFLKPFQDRTATGGYVGLGKLIDAAVRFAAYTDDPKVLERKEHLVDAIIATQEPDGYIGMFAPEARLWSLWDIHEMAYLVYGLTMDYRYFTEERSLDAARRAADYVIAGWNADPEREPGGGSITVYMAVTGLEPALLALHEATGDAKYLDFCLNQRKLAEWDGPIVEGRWGPIQGHAYAYMARCIAQLRLYRLQPQPQLLVPSRRVMDYLLAQDGLVVTGTCGQHECWHSTQEGAANLGETCATAYELRFFDELLRMEGKPLYGDLMERAVYNALFAAQSPDGRRIRYYSPQEGERQYFEGDTYCCPCNYRRIIAELPGMIYYRSDDGIVVSLYAPSEVTFPVSGVQVKLVQETEYPTSGTVRLRVEPEAPVEFSIQLRVPGWCDGAQVKTVGATINGDGAPGTLLTLHREWKEGDEITLELPMSLRMVRGRKAQAGRVAVMYGPRVFCLNPELNPALGKEDLRLITINPATLKGPIPDTSVRPGGLACTVSAWRTTNWYPMAKPDWELTLTEFPDPGGVATYFHVPNPNDAQFVDDELSLDGNTN